MPNTTKSSQRGRRAKSNTKNAKGRDYVTHRQAFGGKIDVPQNPPDIQYMPWCPVTLVSLGQPTSGMEAFKVVDILGLLRSQLDPTNRGFNQVKEGESRFMVQFRLKSVRVWNLSGYMVSMSIDDFSDVVGAKGDRDQLFSAVDTGTSTVLPRVGYQLPASHRSMVLRTDDTTGQEYIFTVQVATRDRVLIYIDIEWRFDGPPKIYSFQSPLIQLTQVATSSRAIMTSIRDTVNKIEEKQSDVVTEVVDDVKKVASLVVPVALASDTVKYRALETRVQEMEELMAKLGNKLEEQSGYCSSYDEILVCAEESPSVPSLLPVTGR